MQPPNHLFQGVRWSSAGCVGVNDAVQGGINQRNGCEQATYHLCRSASEMLSAFGLNLAGGIGIGLASAQAKLEMVQRANIAQQDLTLVVRSTNYAEYSANSPSLRPNLNFFDYSKKRLANQDAFTQEYGENWVSSLRLGSEFCAYYRLHSTQSLNQNQLLGMLAASGISLSGSLSASLQATVDKLATQQNLQVSFDCRLLGMTGVLPLPRPEEYVGFALRIAGSVANSPVILGFDTSPYSVVGIVGFTGYA